jgi:hypothetical protein
MSDRHRALPEPHAEGESSLPDITLIGWRVTGMAGAPASEIAAPCACTDALSIPRLLMDDTKTFVTGGVVPALVSIKVLSCVRVSDLREKCQFGIFVDSPACNVIQ